MRLNQYLAFHTGISRRGADREIVGGHAKINGRVASLGATVNDTDIVELNGRTVSKKQTKTTLMLHKPAGFVCSRKGQGSKTIYDLLPTNARDLKPVGRLDKDSSGLLLITDDGDLAQKLTHPSYEKSKVYEVTLDKPVTDFAQQKIRRGIQLEDGLSKLNISKISDLEYRVVLHEGRNRQIRRTFQALGYEVTKLHRTEFGKFQLGDLGAGSYKEIL